MIKMFKMPLAVLTDATQDNSSKILGISKKG